MFVLFKVEILAGKDKGKQGKVTQVFRHRNWVILEGLNTVSKRQNWIEMVHESLFLSLQVHIAGFYTLQTAFVIVSKKDTLES